MSEIVKIKIQRVRYERGKLKNPSVQNFPYSHAPTKKDK